MSKSIAERLLERRAEVVAEAKALAETASVHNRDLSSGEQAKFDQLAAEADKLAERAKAIRQGENDAADLEASFRSRTGQEPQRGTGMPGGAEATGARYGVSDASLTRHWEAVSRGETASAREEFRALVTTSGMGVAASWGSKPAGGAVSLREFAGITVRPLDGLSAQHPSVTLPAGAAGVNESTAHTEFDAVTSNSLTAARFGAWSDVSAAVKAFDDLGALAAAHAVHISRSLTLADAGTIETAAGSATAYSASTFEQDLREAIFTAAEAASVDPGMLVVFGRPAALAVATGYSPTNGADRGSVVERIHGARVYPTLGATASQLTIFVPSAFIAFETPVGSATTIEPSTGATRFGSWLHSTAAGPAVVGAAAAIATA